MNWCKFLWGNPCKAIETFYHWDSWLWDVGFSTHFSYSAAWKNLGTKSAVSFLHVYLNRDGNCNCLLWYTARWTPIANNLQEFLVHAVLSLDSWPRRFFHNFRFWRPNSYFVYLARCFFWPLSSVCDNQVLVSSDESPGHTVQYGLVSQTLVFLICTILPKISSGGIFVIHNKIPSHFESNSWISSFRRTTVNRSA